MGVPWPAARITTTGESGAEGEGTAFRVLGAGPAVRRDSPRRGWDVRWLPPWDLDDQTPLIAGENATSMDGGGPMSALSVPVVLVDDHQLVLLGLRTLFHNRPEVEVVAYTDDADAAIEVCRRQRPRVAVLDVALE